MGRAVVSPWDIVLWFSDVGSFTSKRPEVKEALQNPVRVFNQDKTAVELGVRSQWVLTLYNTKQVYH